MGNRKMRPESLYVKGGNTLKIYVGHPSSIQFRKELYRPLKESSLSNEHELVFPHEDSERPFDSKTFLKEEADLFIAKVSEPSTGLGIELGWADLFEVPVICIHREDTEVSG
jgi:hypothetical protein